MKKIFILSLFVLTLMQSAAFAEERFVGEFMNTGYYAEVDYITLSEYYLVTNVTIKKPFYNKFIKETVRFDRQNNTYEILKREIYQYNPREFAGKEKVSGIAMPLTNGSPYELIMKFVIDWQKMTEYDI